MLKIRHQLKHLVEPGPITFVGVMPFPRYPGSNRSALLLKLMLGKRNRNFYSGGDFVMSYSILIQWVGYYLFSIYKLR